MLEPLHRRHAAELWDAARDADASWAYLSYGPFPTEDALAAHVAELAASHDPMAWAVRPVATGVVSGWITLMDMQPRHAAIELGNIWFAPRLQRTRAATEAMFLLLRLAADDLGYRRLVLDDGWAPEEYAAWVARLAAASFLPEGASAVRA